MVQAYFSAPQGVLGKPAKQLAAFQKTRLLQTGESQKVLLSWKVNDMASYDDLGKIKASAYILEKGCYTASLWADRCAMSQSCHTDTKYNRIW